MAAVYDAPEGGTLGREGTGGGGLIGGGSVNWSLIGPMPLWALSELDALLLARMLRAGDGDTALEQGWLLRELHERFGLTASELARRFDKSPSWVSRRLALAASCPTPCRNWCAAACSSPTR